MKNLILIFSLLVPSISFSQVSYLDTLDENVLMVIDLNDTISQKSNKVISWYDTLSGVFWTTFDSNTINGTIDTFIFSKITIGYSNTNPYPKNDGISYIIFNGKENILQIKSPNSNEYKSYKLTFDSSGGRKNSFCKTYKSGNNYFIGVYYNVIDNKLKMSELRFKETKKLSIIYSD